MAAAPLRPHGIVRAVEAVHDGFARQAVDAAAIEDIANVAKQDDGGIFILLLLAIKTAASLARVGQSAPNASAMAMRGRQLSA